MGSFFNEKIEKEKEMTGIEQWNRLSRCRNLGEYGSNFIIDT